MKTWLARVPFVMLGLSFVGCSEPPTRGGTSDQQTPYAERRAAFHTKLVFAGPSPQEWEREEPPPGVREVSFPSGELELKAWLHVPAGKEERRPAIAYFHGGFAFGASDFDDCQPFVDAGFVVMTPIFRGENGNPGNFEMFWGEVDDAIAAVKWLHAQPLVDPDRVYTFGHSSGGVLSALVSLWKDVPIQHGGSSGGLYGTDVFDRAHQRWRVPFDRANPVECQLRVLPGNVKWMQHRHYAYIGKDDVGVMAGVESARSEAEKADSLLTIVMIPGDHGSSLEGAMHEYVKLIQKGR
jgi:dienelactone hydrolase